LSQHPLNGVQSCECDAIGPSQGGAPEEEPDLRRQVQNFAAHGIESETVSRTNNR
jgi:hypothetical protein